MLFRSICRNARRFGAASALVQKQFPPTGRGEALQSNPFRPKCGKAKPRIVLAGVLGGILGGAKAKEDEAEMNLYKEELSEEEEKPKEVPETHRQIVELIKLAILNMQKGDFNKSEETLHIALKMAQDLNNQAAVTYIFDILANVAFKKGDFMKAKRLFVDVIERTLAEGIPAEDNKIIEMSLKLAVIYGEHKEYKNAEKGFKFCIQTQEDKIRKASDEEASEDTLALWGMARDFYAQHLMDRGMFTEAFSQFQEAFLTSCELFGDTHPQSLVLINSLGTVCTLRDKHSDAVNYFEKAIRLAKQTGDENLATFMVNLGMSKIRQGLTEEAGRVCAAAQNQAYRLRKDDVAAEAEECVKIAKEVRAK